MPLLHEVLEQTAEKYPNNAVFDSVESQISFKEFVTRTRYLAGALEDLGINKGDRLAILAQNQPDYIAYHYAASMIGAILLVINIRHTEDEMLWALSDAEASILITESSFSDKLPGLTQKCSFITTTIGLDFSEGVGHVTDELVNKKLFIKNPPALSETDPLLLIYTSGTTGRPKGAMQTHQGSTMIDRLTAENLRITDNDVYLAFMPFFHQAGLIRARATMSKGGTSLVPGRMDPETMVKLITEKNVSITMLPTPYDTFLTDIAERDNLTFPSLRFIVGGGGIGPAHAAKMKEFCDKFDCNFMGVYGQTEVTGPATIIIGQEYFDHPNSCGKPMDGIGLEIWDESGKPAATEVVGEIMISGNSCTSGYWNNPEGTKKLFTGQWLHTGDLGSVDQDGFLYFADRIKELIKTGAENVYPKEVELALSEHPAIADMTIIGLPDPKWGEAVTAVIVKNPGTDLTLEELKDFCRGKIAGYKIPNILKIVDEIPRNVTGKVKKVDLRQQFS